MTFFELEKECKKRRIKKNVLHIFIIIFLIVVLIFIKLIMDKKSKNVNKNNNIINSEIIKKVKKTNKNKILTPIIELNISDNKIHKKEKKAKKINKKTKKTENNKTKKLILNTSTLPSFETCILLAEKYYNNKDYENALKWAKNANIQNKKSPKSWIIVAKSLYKLNKKDKAVKILQIYYKYTKNRDVLKLIERMKNGENF